MNELVFELTTLEPKEFFGEDNKHLDLLKNHFPKLKIVARGHKIRAYGVKEELETFSLIYEKLIRSHEQRSSISSTEFENLLSDHVINNPYLPDENNILIYKVSGKPIKPQNRSQQQFIKLANNRDMVFALGPAGTGKTYISVAMAVKALKNKQVKRIILTRPAVEAGENLGFLPGDIREKLDPYMQPLYDALYDMIPIKKLEEYIDHRIIEIAPLAFMRGRTLDDAFVILDEAQNTTHAQMKMFLTRMGKTAKFIITGDPGQIDLPGKTTSGLKEATLLLKDTLGIGIMYLHENDVVRHPLVKHITNAYNNAPQIP